jgi:hypothetical protein
VIFTRYQPIVMVNNEASELEEVRLDHETGEPRPFYRRLHGTVRVGIEATDPMPWYERLLGEQGYELWTGDELPMRREAILKLERAVQQ